MEVAEGSVVPVAALAAVGPLEQALEQVLKQTREQTLERALARDAKTPVAVKGCSLEPSMVSPLWSVLLVPAAVIHSDPCFRLLWNQRRPLPWLLSLEWRIVTNASPMDLCWPCLSSVDDTVLEPLFPSEGTSQPTGN